MQKFLGAVLILPLLVASLLFVRQQWRTLQWLDAQEHLPREDRQYYRWRSYRRLVGCGLMLALALLLIHFFFFGVMDRMDELVARSDEARAGGLPLTAKEEADAYSLLTYVGVIALLLFVLLAVAFVDLMAIRRYGMRHRQRIREDRQAMLQRQLPQLWRDRNGHRK